MAGSVQALIAKLQAPVLVTPKAKGIVSEEHPLFAGVATGMALDREVVATLHTADLVLGIGFDPVESDKTWFASLPLVALDTVSMAEGSYRPTEAIGNLPALIAELATLVDAKPWPAGLLRERQAAVRPKFAEDLHRSFPATPDRRTSQRLPARWHRSL